MSRFFCIEMEDGVNKPERIMTRREKSKEAAARGKKVTLWRRLKTVSIIVHIITLTSTIQQASSLASGPQQATVCRLKKR